MYARLLSSHPLLVKSATSGVLTFSGDIACQIFFQDEKYNPARTARFTFLGALLCGAPLHYWYGFLAQKFPGQTLAAATSRLAIDQLVFAPTFIPIFMSSVLLLEGKTRAEIENKVKSEYVGALKANYAVWIPAQFINFYFVPVPFQVLMSNVTGLVWNTYFSFISYREGEKSSVNKQ